MCWRDGFGLKEIEVRYSSVSIKEDFIMRCSDWTFCGWREIVQN
jgi:hypothetical protein